MPELFDHFRAMVGGIPKAKQSEAETEPIVGFRAWQLVDGPEGIPLLYSCNQDCCWPPYEALHANPENYELAGAVTGIYAFNKPELAPSYFGDNHIMGEVYLWGEVIEHSQGYRAEYAYPKELWVDKDFDAAMIVRLEETYGVPVVIKEDLPVEISAPVTSTFRSGASGLIQHLLELVKDCVYDREPLVGYRRMLFMIPLGQSSYGKASGQFMKTYQYTNLLQAGMLDAPRKLLVKQIRCTFFEDDKPLPVSDRIYWNTSLEFLVNQKCYWRGPAAYAADPLMVLAGTDWSKLPVEHAEQILERLTLSLTSEASTNKFGGNAFGLSANGPISIDGVLIDQQQFFCVKIETDGPVTRQIEVLVGLIGTGARAVI